MKYCTVLIATLAFVSVNAKVYKGSLTLNDDVNPDVAVAYFEHDDYNQIPTKVDQLRRIFLEAVYVAQPGTNITLANSDRSRHNIFINHLGLGLKVNTGIMRRNQQVSYKMNFESGYIVRMGCYIHSKMISYLANIPSNYYSAMVFDNNHPFNRFIVEPVKYAFEIETPETFEPEQLSIILPYVQVDPITLTDSVPATYDLIAEQKKIGTVTIVGIAEGRKKESMPSISIDQANENNK